MARFKTSKHQWPNPALSHQGTAYVDNVDLFARSIKHHEDIMARVAVLTMAIREREPNTMSSEEKDDVKLLIEELRTYQNQLQNIDLDCMRTSRIIEGQAAKIKRLESTIAVMLTYVRSMESFAKSDLAKFDESVAEFRKVFPEWF
jgi:hypothetical protein